MTDREYLKRCKLLGCNTEQFSYIAEHKEDSYIVDKLKKVLPEASLEQLLSIAEFELITQEGTSEAVIALANTFGSEFAQQIIDEETSKYYGEFINKRIEIRTAELDLGNLIITWVGSMPPVRIRWRHDNKEHTGLFSRFIFVVDGHLAFVSNDSRMYALKYDTESCEWYLDNTGIDREKQHKAEEMAGFVFNKYI